MKRLGKSAHQLTALPREVSRVSWNLSRLYLKIPHALLFNRGHDQEKLPYFSLERIESALGDLILKTFDDLGPVYGKGAQVWLSRRSSGQGSLVDRLQLERLYGEWPAIPMNDVEAILDQHDPGWRSKIRLDSRPLGVASLAQVHRFQDLSGQQWALKVIKPHAARRLKQSLDAIEQGLAVLRLTSFTRQGRRLIREWEELCKALNSETRLDLERRNLERIGSKWDSKRGAVLRLPKINHQFSSKTLLALELFEGTPLVEVVRDGERLGTATRRKLARKIVGELLVQVFEMGLFHADPHAGNLILLENGDLGLFDWGLTGELTATDRRHISQMLKAVMALDMDRMATVLVQMAAADSKDISIKLVKKELKELGGRIKSAKEKGTPLSLLAVFDLSMAAADRLEIRIPQGLLIMAKTLITVEGLAKGLDPQLTLGKVAAPYFFKAAQPDLRELWQWRRRIPALFFRRSPKSSEVPSPS